MDVAGEDGRKFAKLLTDALYAIKLREGKNREIRRLLARAGHKVINLQRIAFGPLRLGNLEAGKCRELRPHEIQELYAFVQAPISQRSDRPVKFRGPKSGGSSEAKGRRKSRKSSPEGETGVGRRGAARHGLPKGPAGKPGKRAPKGRSRKR